MADPKEMLEAGADKSVQESGRESSAEKPLTPLESALAKWEKYFTPEEQAALRAYESEQGTVE